MNNNTFFKPTPLYKEFMILDLIEKNKNITQREIANEIGVAVSLVNNYLDEYEGKGLIRRKRYSTKTVEYFCTKKGTERRNLLNISYLSSTQKIYISARCNIENYLSQLSLRGIKKILFYGAGDVALIILNTINTLNDNDIIVLGIIDDDVHKQGSEIAGYKIYKSNKLSEFNYDGILISTYSNNQDIYENLINVHSVNRKKIIRYFE